MFDNLFGKKIDYAVLAQRHDYDKMAVEEIKRSVKAYCSNGYTVVGVPSWVGAAKVFDLDGVTSFPRRAGQR